MFTNFRVFNIKLLWDIDLTNLHLDFPYSYEQLLSNIDNINIDKAAKRRQQFYFNSLIMKPK